MGGCVWRPAAGIYVEALDPDTGLPVPFDTRGARVWPGRMLLGQPRIDLIVDRHGDLFAGSLPADAVGEIPSADYYRPLPGARWAFWTLTPRVALQLCNGEGIPVPSEVLAAYEASRSRPTSDPDPSVADAAAGAEVAAPPSPIESPDLVTLNQAAAIVHVSKRTLERHKTSGKLPDPAIEGGAGKAARYDWKVMRPWLESKFKMKLPEVFPANRRHA
jgi:hypothetical protein